MQPLDCSGAQLGVMPLAFTARQNTRSAGTSMVGLAGTAGWRSCVGNRPMVRLSAPLILKTGHLPCHFISLRCSVVATNPDLHGAHKRVRSLATD
jgi:hypothetical protein